MTSINREDSLREDSLVVQPTLTLSTPHDLNGPFCHLYEERRQEILRRLRQGPGIIQAFTGLWRGKTYQLVIPPRLEDPLKTGQAVLDRYSNVVFGPRIRDPETGRILGHIRLKEVHPELLSSVAPLLTQVAVQSMVADILQRLEVLEEQLEAVLRGQRLDRLAEVKGGIDLYRQAIVARDRETRRQLLGQAITTLTRGRARCEMQLKDDLQRFDEITRRYKQRFNEIPSTARAVHEGFKAILAPSMGLGCAYEALGEPEALRESLKQLATLIREVGPKGARVARYLPYHAENPPEELWNRSQQQVDFLISSRDQIEAVNRKAIELVLTPEEILKGGGR